MKKFKNGTQYFLCPIVSELINNSLLISIDVIISVMPVILQLSPIQQVKCL